MKSSRIIQLSTLAAATLCFLFALSLLIYRLPINSDLLVFDDLFSSLARGVPWSNWRMPPAPGYVPDLALYGLSTLILKSAASRLFFTSAAQAILCLGAAMWLAKRLSSRASCAALAAIICLLSATVITSTRSTMWLFLNSDNVHVGVTLFGLLSLIALIRCLQRQSFTSAALLMLMGVVATLSSALYTVVFVAPAIVTVVLNGAWKHYRLSNSTNRTSMLALIAIVFGQIAAKIIHPIITYHDALSGRIPISSKSMGNSLALFSKAIACLFVGPGVTTHLFAILISILVLIAFRKVPQPSALQNGAVGDEDNLISWTFLFAKIAVATTVSGCILSGAFMDSGALRYLAYPLSLFCIIAALKLDMVIKPVILLLGVWACTALIAIAIILTFPQLKRQSANRTIGEALEIGSYYIPGKFDEDGIAQCVKHLESDGLPLQAGASYYWLARSIQYRNPNHPMLPIDTNLWPVFWMMDTGPIQINNRYKRFYNFVILNKIDPIKSNFVPAVMGSVVPPGYQRFSCPYANAVVLYYPSDELDKTLRAKAREYVGGPFYD